MELRLVVFLVLVAIEIQNSFVNCFDYCSITCNGIPHTMCQVKKGTGKCAPGSLSDDDKRIILNAHNRLRKNIALANNTGQPPASNMRAMSWDNEIAKIAQRWVETCPNGHDQCRVLQNKESVGQNQAYEGNTRPMDRKKTIEKLVQMWYDEIKNMNPKTVGSYAPTPPETQTGHYTQVVWAETYRIGCGVGFTKSGAMNEYFLICNYYPAGNFRNLPVYLEGKECSNCPEGTKCGKKWAGLCSTEEDEKGGIPPNKSISAFSNASLQIVMYCLYFVLAFFT